MTFKNIPSRSSKKSDLFLSIRLIANPSSEGSSEDDFENFVKNRIQIKDRSSRIISTISGR